MHCTLCDNFVESDEYMTTRCCEEIVHKFCDRYVNKYLRNCVLCHKNYNNGVKINFVVNFNMYQIIKEIALLKNIYGKFYDDDDEKKFDSFNQQLNFYIDEINNKFPISISKKN